MNKEQFSHQTSNYWIDEVTKRLYTFCLRTAGNQKVVYVQTAGKGYRKPHNTRNPHSWSIANPKATIAWLLQH